MVSGQQYPFTCAGRVLAVDITHAWQTDSPDSISNILPIHPSNVDIATEVIEASVVVGNCHPYSVFAYECFTSWATYRPVLQHSLCPHMDCQTPEDLVLRATGICATRKGQHRQIDRPLCLHHVVSNSAIHGCFNNICWMPSVTLRSVLDTKGLLILCTPYAQSIVSCTARTPYTKPLRK